ncbi:pacman [Carabus blaptoides fortunei]
MGVPKFFRYISERYPCLSELVKEYQIPDFDNLYLDMNGIIHMCSHPDDYDPHFRISEEKIFSDIFHYIEVLFRMIKPQKLFFMAVDGVAPRAKMNQQRGRRFRSAKDAEVLEAKAKERGEELPAEARFDSNCITPGTVFMARLQEQLKYFVTNKISNDKLWQKCKVVLSGHETPGEGEHKIMDYIRYMKAQPGYDPNTRHCLYGLDADLIMLGLCTHEPHFSLLREEVRFGKKAKRKNVPEQITFYLLHLSLMREYLELEFLPLKESLPFAYDMEKIIDDWVLMGFLVGNDFIPHLPNLHIANGALPVLYNAYMKILPTLNGYINEAGSLNLDRFEKFMAALGAVDMDHFSEQYADLKYFQSKTGRRPNAKERTSYKPRDLEVWQADDSENGAGAKTTMNKDLEALIKSTDDMLLDDPFLGDETDNVNTTQLNLLSTPELTVNVKTTDLLPEENFKVTRSISEASTVLLDLDPPGVAVDDPTTGPTTDVENGVEKLEPTLLEPSESVLAELALDDIDLHDDEDALSPYYSEPDTEEDDLMNAEFIQHKNDYYMNKLDYSKVTPEIMRDQAEGYVRAIQWNLNYYYNGVCSWSWYYPHHYAPYISDIRDFSNLKLEYDLGKPFQPFEQLLAVLPAASKNLLPEPYRELMTAETSPIIDYYPPDFRTDLNGKKQEWEAVVLIPFIAEDTLLDAMAPCNERLSSEEVQRNTHGPMLVFVYSSDDLGAYAAPEYYPTIEHNHALATPVTIEDIRVPIEQLVKGPCPGSIHDVYYPGFPTLRHLKYDGYLEKAKVKVFDTPSQNENMIVKIVASEEQVDIEALARKLLGKTVHVSWPHLIEAQVVTVSDANCRYHRSLEEGKFNLEVNKGSLGQLWYTQRNSIALHYKEKLGIEVGETSILVHVKVLAGQKYVSTQTGLISMEKQWAKAESCYPLQSVVRELVVHEGCATQFANIQDLFPLKSKCFMIGHPHYGTIGEVIDNTSLKSGRIKVSVSVLAEPDISFVYQLEKETKYMPGGVAAQRLAITPHLLSRITGTIFAIPGVKGSMTPKNSSKMNIGLNLKLNKKNEEIPGYTKKVEGQWLYSYKSVQLVKDYMKFCPDLFTYIAAHLGNDVFYESELFPTEIGEGRIQKLVEWLKKQPFAAVERQKVGSKAVDVEIVKKIEEIVDTHNAGLANPKQVVMQVKPHLLYKPEIQSGHLPPDPSVTYQLYDRVVNVRESYTVPFGCRGTVIGIQGPTSPQLAANNTNTSAQDDLYDVVFDQPFAGGLQISCSANRGYRVPRSALINVSHGARVVQQKSVNPVTNVPYYGKVNQQQLNQQQLNHHLPVQSQNSAFASWSPPSSTPQQQQQQQMYIQHRPMQPLPFGVHPINAPVRQQPVPKQAISAEFQAFMQDLKKSQNKTPKPKQPAGPTSAPQVAQLIPLTASPKSPSQPKQVSTDETELLKKLLNIPVKDKSSKPPGSPSTSSTSSSSEKKMSVQDFFAHARNNKQKLVPAPAQLTNSPYFSVQLLNYCQLHRIGIPRYTYFPCADNKIRAQINLPDGRMVIGDESTSKEQAAENAAKIIMTDNARIVTAPPLKKAPHQGYPAPSVKGFPVPPKQWCQNQPAKHQRPHKPSVKNNQQQQQQVNVQQQQLTKALNGAHTRKEPATKAEETKGGATPFVPLQAVKQQRHKAHSTGTNPSKHKHSTTSNNHSANSTASTSKSTTSSHSDKQTDSQQTNTTSPKKRTRKCRIAANFTGLQPKQ